MEVIAKLWSTILTRLDFGIQRLLKLFESIFAMAAGTGQGYHSTQYHKDKNYYMLHVEYMTLEYALMQCCVYHELSRDTNLQKFDALSTARHPRQSYSQYLVSQYSPYNFINLIHTWGLSICKNL